MISLAYDWSIGPGEGFPSITHPSLRPGRGLAVGRALADSPALRRAGVQVRAVVLMQLKTQRVKNVVQCEEVSVQSCSLNVQQ